MTRFEQVVKIMDDSVGGPTAPVRAHGPFWRRKTRDQFVALKVFGLDLLILGQGASSNFVKALKGQTPFDGTQFPRMPAGRPPVSSESVAFIERWIDDGCPEDMVPANGELTWRPTNAPMANQEAGKRYDDIWFVTPQLGWGVNSDGKILRTDDGGDTWDEQFHDELTYLRCVGFASKTRGWAGTLSGPARLYQTRNGGAKWTPVTKLPAKGPKMVCGMSVVSESVVYVSGTNYPFPFEDNDPPAMMKTLDGGATWKGWDMRKHSCLLVDTFFTSPKTGWVVGGFRPDPSVPAGPNGRDNVKAVVLRTEDGGKTWVNRAADLLDELSYGEWGWKIDFVDDEVGYVSLENFVEGAILKTTDGGTTWKRLPINDPQKNANLEGVGFVDRDHGWVGGWGTPAFEGGQSSATDDGGTTWRDANEIGKFINRFRFFHKPEIVGYSAGATVYKYSSAPVPTPAERALAIPAPRLLAGSAASGDGVLRIPVTVPEGASRLVANVWERFGHHVRRLVDEADPAPGDRTIEWDMTDDAGRPVRPGTYIVRITVDDDSESQIVRVDG